MRRSEILNTGETRLTRISKSLDALEASGTSLTIRGQTLLQVKPNHDGLNLAPQWTRAAELSAHCHRCHGRIGHRLAWQGRESWRGPANHAVNASEHSWHWNFYHPLPD